MRDDVPLTLTAHGWVDGERGLDGTAARARVLSSAENLLDHHVPAILFDAEAARAPGGGFRWEVLAGDGGPDPRARLAAQYHRANVTPSDRYVLSVAGSTKHRLGAHDPEELENLYLAGDWIRNGMNCGAMESAVLGGLLASSALSGYP